MTMTMEQTPCLWHPQPTRTENVFVLFQTVVRVDHIEQLRFDLFGSSMYRVYWDGEERLEGPARFSPDHPEFDTLLISTTADQEHVLSVIVHDYGVHTRILMGGIHPFLQCEVTGEAGVLQLEWQCKELTAYLPVDRRVNGQLGWMESCDTRQLPPLDQAFAGTNWIEPLVIEHPLGEVAMKPLTIEQCVSLPVEAIELDRGTFIDRFGYDNDDLPVRFLYRDLKPTLPPEGIWVRFDLGKIALFRPRITLDLPEGTLIEAGYSESLTDGRVYPVIPLSASTSCHVDRWIAKGGVQQLQTFVPRGFRYLEVHIYAPSELVNTLSITAGGIQRTLYDLSPGTFECSDPLLNSIWHLGVETLRSCSEDALIDTPTRERGQWIGDAATIGMDMLAVSFGDLSLVRRALEQASYRRREDGLAAGLCPGQEGYLTTYALYWIDLCIHYNRLTGDNSLLIEGYDTAEKTIEFFFKHLTERGMVAPDDTWDFIDWGYEVKRGDINISLNVALLHTLKQLYAWEQAAGMTDKAELRTTQIAAIRHIVDSYYYTADGLLAKSIPAVGEAGSVERQAGYHATVLGLLHGIIEDDAKPRAIEFIKRHILSSFPNNADAPRLAHPSANDDPLITPAFFHFALKALWEAGEVDFVLEQYRICWGWMLEQGVTTLLEVFDTRWSHCHAWAGCPTWQLSRYALGLIPDNVDHYRLRFQPGPLTFASGHVPHISKQALIRIEWKQIDSEQWAYTLHTEHPISVVWEEGYDVASFMLDGKETAIAQIAQQPFVVQTSLNIIYTS